MHEDRRSNNRILCEDIGAEMEDLVYLPEEIEEGNVEYKRGLISPTPERLVKLTSQMKWRLFEGNGEALYEIGVDDDGSPFGLTEDELEASLSNLNECARRLNCETSVVCNRKGRRGQIAEVLVREINNDKYQDIRVAVCGNVDAGKSTLTGVLTSNTLDNGRGLMRVSCFKHSHEVTSGRTSSIGYQIMGFNAKGECVNDNTLHKLSWGDIVKQSYKVITFLDLAGHERYIKTTISGISGHIPDYCFLVIGANMGITKMTREHMRLALAMKIPIIVIVTKIDMCPDNVLKRTMQEIRATFRSTRKRILAINDSEDLVSGVKNIATGAICPMFKVSNVTGEGIDMLRSFLNMLQPRIQWDELKDHPAEVLIDESYSISGVGTVATGVVISGTVNRGDTLLLGPDGNGNFKEVVVRNLQINKTNRQSVSAGVCAGFSLPKIKRKDLRKGMVLAAPEANVQASWCFEAKIYVLHHSSTIKVNYQPVVQCMSMRQTAKITHITNREILRTGDRSTVRFKFMFRPECIKEGYRIILREGSCKAIGVITKVISNDTKPSQVPIIQGRPATIVCPPSVNNSGPRLLKQSCG